MCCLVLLDQVLHSRMPRRVLDLGSGTGVLAIAAAKALHRRVLASDIDPVSARTARDNARLTASRRSRDAERSSTPEGCRTSREPRVGSSRSLPAEGRIVLPIRHVRTTGPTDGIGGGGSKSRT